MVAWQEETGLTAGKIMFNRDMFYSATDGKIAYNEWMKSVKQSMNKQIVLNVLDRNV